MPVPRVTIVKPPRISPKEFGKIFLEAKKEADRQYRGVKAAVKRFNECPESKIGGCCSK